MRHFSRSPIESKVAHQPQFRGTGWPQFDLRGQLRSQLTELFLLDYFESHETWHVGGCFWANKSWPQWPPRSKEAVPKLPNAKLQGRRHFSRFPYESKVVQWPRFSWTRWPKICLPRPIEVPEAKSGNFLNFFPLGYFETFPVDSTHGGGCFWAYKSWPPWPQRSKEAVHWPKYKGQKFKEGGIFKDPYESIVLNFKGLDWMTSNPISEANWGLGTRPARGQVGRKIPAH